ncbi:InlB B-repeat-containing protein [Candidatus Enterococcus murrayae]|uniref:InlB B-repeat-containing protein n=1 Tax=Candidatus Enterococcus murrayae TaxID=2815321 RepID=A0ABS3HKE3_9ENTE|nr:InlB B-repeat-containing protein [Enterococcus sp. MJM16]MBO0453773.1 InlB B-repeat-containing protein [Enterococcus sp. MJM16]
MKKEKVKSSVSNDNKHRQLSKKNVQRQLISVATSCFFLCSGYILPTVQAIAGEEVMTTQESSSQAKENLEQQTEIPENTNPVEMSEPSQESTTEKTASSGDISVEGSSTEKTATQESQVIEKKESKETDSTNNMMNAHHDLNDDASHTYTIEKENGGTWKSSSNDEVKWSIFEENGEQVLLLSKGTLNTEWNEKPPWRSKDWKDVITEVRFSYVEGGKKLHSTFLEMTNLKTFDSTGLSTSNVQYFESMLSGATNLTTLNLSTLDTSSAITMWKMFSECSSLTTLDLSNFDTTSVRNISYMFSNCSKLKTLNLANFNTESLEESVLTFTNCLALEELIINSQGELPFNTGLRELPTSINEGKTSYHWVKNGDYTKTYDSTEDFRLAHNSLTDSDVQTYTIEKRHTIDFDVQGGSTAVTRQHVFDGQNVSDPKYQGTKKGHRFTNWESNDIVYLFDTPVTTPLILTANWRLNQNMIRFYPNKGIGIMEAQPFAFEEEKALTINAFTRTGYRFSHWTVDENGSGKQYTDGQMLKNPLSEDGDWIDLHAQWEANQYTISFKKNQGEGTMDKQPMIYDEEQAINKNAFQRLGYTFDHWNTQENGQGTAYADQQVVKNLTDQPDEQVELTAQWKTTIYTVHFDSKGGEELQSETYTIEKGLQSLPEASRKGYIFVGWYDGQTKVEKIANGSMGDRNLTAHWEVETYPITFDSAGGSTVESLTYTIEDEIMNLPIPTKIGYSFEGWYNGKQKVTRITKGTTGAIQLTAKWQMTTYTLTFETAGEAIAPISYTIESSIELPISTHVRGGYTFNGWLVMDKKNRSMAGDILTRIEPGTLGSMTLTESWQANPYSIHFDANGGSGIMPDQGMTYDQLEKLQKNSYTHTGYRFTVWNTRADGKGTSYTDQQNIKNLAEAGTITLYAQWEMITSSLEDLVNQEKEKNRQPLDYTSESWKIYEEALKEAVALLSKGEMDETKAQEAVKNLEQAIAGLRPVTTNKAIPLSTLSKPRVSSSTPSAKKYPPTGMLQGTGMVIAGLVIIVAAIVGWKRKK